MHLLELVLLFLLFLFRNLQFYNSPALGHISPTRFASPCHLIEDESPTTILGDRYYYPREDGSPPRRLTNGYHYPREEERLANGYHYPREDGSPRTRLANGYHYSREDGSPPRLANGYHYPREDRIPPRRLAKDYPREESPPTRRHSRYARDEGSPTTRWQEEGSPPTRLYSGHYLPRVPSPTRAGSGRRARSVSSLSNQGTDYCFNAPKKVETACLSVIPSIMHTLSAGYLINCNNTALKLD